MSLLSRIQYFGTGMRDLFNRATNVEALWQKSAIHFSVSLLILFAFLSILLRLLEAVPLEGFWLYTQTL